MPSKRTELLSPEGEERATQAAIDAALDRFEAIEAREAAAAQADAATQAVTEPAEPAAQAVAESAPSPTVAREPTPAPRPVQRAAKPTASARPAEAGRRVDAGEPSAREELEEYLDGEYGNILHIGDPSKGEDSAKVYVGDKTSDDFISTFEILDKFKAKFSKDQLLRIVEDWIVSRYLTLRSTRSVEVEAAERAAAAAARAGGPPAGLPAQAGGPPRPPRAPGPEPRLQSERTEGQKLKREAVKLWKELQKLQQKLDETRLEMKKYKGLFGVRAKDRDKYDELQERSWELEEDLAELKEDYNERAEEAAEFLKVKASTLKAEIEAGATGRRAAETQQRRPGLIPDAPARTPGEGDQEYLTRWQRVKDAAVSGVKFLPKMVWGVASTLLGVRAAETTIRFFAERGRLKKEKKAFGSLVEEMRSILDQQSAAGITTAERERIGDESIAKVGALEERMRSLEQDGYLKAEDRQRMMRSIEEVMRRRQQTEQNAQAARNQEVSQILQDYFQRRASGLELGKQYSNLGLLLSGWQFGRAVTYGGLTVLQRAIRARGQQEGAFNLAETQRPQAWQKARDLGVLKDITVNASLEFGKGLTGVVWDIIKNKQTKRGDFARLKMGTRKAVGTAALMAGFATLVYAEATEIGPQDQIESVLQKMEKNGMAQTLGHNYLHTLEQLSFGLFRFGEDGELKVADNPDEGIAKPAVAAEVAKAPEVPEVPEVTKTPDELAYESALQRLENSSGGKIDFNPDTGRVEIILGEGGYEQIQHALRDLAVLEKMLTDKSFTTLDAAHVENVVANLKYLLEGKDLRFMEAERLDGIAHLGAGKLIIHDVAKFHEVMQGELLAHAADKITAGNLGRYDEVVATINNTSDSNWQADVDVATGVSKAGETGYVEVEIDHQAVHQAEIEVAQHETAGHEIPGLTVNPAEVTDEATYPMHLGKDVIPVEDGVIDHVIVTRGDNTFDYPLDEPIDIAHPYAGEEIKDALDKAYTEAVSRGVGEPAAEAGAVTTSVATEQAPVGAQADFSELIKTPVAEGGLVGPDGYVHFGDVQFKTEWLDKIDERGVIEFSNDPIEVAKIPWYMRLSNEALTLRALAETIKHHPDTGTVGDYIVKHQEELAGWMRETPPTPRAGEGIGGV